MADTAGLPDLRDLKEKLEKAGGDIAVREFAARKAMASRVVTTAQGLASGKGRGVKKSAESLRVATYKDIVRVKLGDTLIVKGWPRYAWQIPMNFGAYHDLQRRVRFRKVQARSTRYMSRNARRFDDYVGNRSTPNTIKGWNMFPPYQRGEDQFLYRSISREAPALFEEYKSLFHSLF